MSKTAWAPAIAIACTSLLGCTRGTTQLIVAVDSDLAPVDRACIHAEIVRVEEPDASSESFFHATGTRTPRGEIPFSFGVTAPSGDAARRVEILVSALRDGDGCRTDTFSASDVVVTRRVRTGFVEGHALLVPVFLASACVGVTCGDAESCDAGVCVPADVDPSSLRTITPGEEFSDAGVRRDASPSTDAGPVDAGPVVTDFAPTLTAPSYTLELTGSQPAYPVGVSGADRVIVAGYATDALTLGTSSVAAGSLWLAALSPTGAPDWVTSTPAVSYPWPQVRRVVPYADGYVACASVNGSVTLGAAAACTARPCVVLARLDRAGVPTAVRRLDAAGGEIWCTDLEVIGGRALVGARTFEVTALEVDDTPVTPTGTVDAASQNVLRAVIDDVGGAFDVSSVTVVGHNPSTFGVMFGNPGSPLLVRSDGAGGEVDATTAQALTLAGASPGGTVALRVARFGPGGETLWSVPSLVALSSGAGLTLHAMSVARDLVWLAVTVSTSAAGERATFTGLPPVTVDRTTAYVVALDLATGASRVVTDVGVGTPAGGEDRFISSPISHMLQGGAIAATGAGDVLFAGAITTGDTIGGTAATVMGENDALVGIVGPDGGVRAAWQWDARTELDARLTHVEWMPGGWVAVGGYAENDGDTWARAGSFLLIHPAR